MLQARNCKVRGLGVLIALIAVMDAAGWAGVGEPQLPDPVDAAVVEAALAESMMGVASRRVVRVGARAFPVVFEVLRKHPQDSVHARAVDLVMMMPHDAAPTYLVAVVRDQKEREAERVTAMAMLAFYTYRREVRALIEDRLRRDASAKMRANCVALVVREIRMLYTGRWNVDQHRVGLVKEASRDQSKVVRLYVAEHVGFLAWRILQDYKEPTWCRQILLRLKGDSDGLVRNAAAAALAKVEQSREHLRAEREANRR